MTGKKLTANEIKVAQEAVKKLESMDDYEKLEYLEYLKLENVKFEILVDNDDVMIWFGEDKNEDGIHCSFYENGYQLLPTIFEHFGFNSDFV